MRAQLVVVLPNNSICGVLLIHANTLIEGRGILRRSPNKIVSLSDRIFFKQMAEHQIGFLSWIARKSMLFQNHFQILETFFKSDPFPENLGFFAPLVRPLLGLKQVFRICDESLSANFIHPCG
jgi:hypothetical protein